MKALLWFFKIGWTYMQTNYSLHCESHLYRNNRTGELRWHHCNE